MGGDWGGGRLGEITKARKYCAGSGPRKHIKIYKKQAKEQKHCKQPESIK